MMRNQKTFSLTFLFVWAFFYSNLLFAADIPNLADVLKTFSDNVPNLMAMTTALAYVMGIFFIVKGVFGLKQYAEQRTMMSSSHSLKGPMIYMAIGAMMIWLPSSIHVAMNTFWTTPTPFSYQTDEGNPWSEMIYAAFIVLQLIGVIAFIRGLVILSHLGSQGGQQGQFGKALAHIIGGTLCINMYDTVRTILYTFGLQDIFG